MIEWTVSQSDCGPALNFLERRIPAAPQSYLRQLLRRGKVHRNRAVLSIDGILLPGDRISLAASARVQELLASPAGQLDILYETGELLVVNKPAGLAVHRSKGHEENNLQARVAALMQGRNAPFSVAPVHRLDLETSGPVLFAKGRRAASLLGRLFMDGAAVKRYLALVAGEITGSGLLSIPVAAKGKLKEAATAFRSLGCEKGFTLLELELHTGRTHQIRQQLAAAGHPLAGDRRYDGPPLTGLLRNFLHCCHLALPDPFGGPPLTINCPLPEELTDFLGRQFPQLAEMQHQ